MGSPSVWKIRWRAGPAPSPALRGRLPLHRDRARPGAPSGAAPGGAGVALHPLPPAGGPGLVAEGRLLGRRAPRRAADQAPEPLRKRGARPWSRGRGGMKERWLFLSLFLGLALLLLLPIWA